MGSSGLRPAENYMDALKETESSPWTGFSELQTLFWFFDLNDKSMQVVVWAGLILSAMVVVGLNSWVAQPALWLLDFSVVAVSGGGPFMPTVGNLKFSMTFFVRPGLSGGLLACARSGRLAYSQTAIAQKQTWKVQWAADAE
jgi:hypothetical protein